jgi:hypothetical protein
MKKALVAGVVFAALAGIAIGQQLTTTGFNGNETWTVAVGGPGGGSQFVTMGQVRNSTGYTLNPVVGSLTIPNNTNRFIVTAQPAVATISLPLSPVFDGQMIEVVNGTASAFAANAVTLQPNTGQTLIGGNVTLTTLGAGASIEVQYSLSNNTWYRIR